MSTDKNTTTSNSKKNERMYIRDDCKCCQENKGNFYPPHDPSIYCESGRQPHCTCESCF